MLFLIHNLLTKRKFSLESYLQKFKLYISGTYMYMYIRKQNREKGATRFSMQGENYIRIHWDEVFHRSCTEAKVCLQVPEYKLHGEYICERPSVIHSCIRLLLFVNFLQGNIKSVKDRKRILFLIVIPYSRIEVTNKRLCLIIQLLHLLHELIHLIKAIFSLNIM